MEIKFVTSRVYVAVDGTKFDDEGRCHSYESEVRLKIYRDISKVIKRTRELKAEMNEYRLEFNIAKCEAIAALAVGRNAKYHRKMVEYYDAKDNYAFAKDDLHDERKKLNKLFNQRFEWFGSGKRKSKVAKDTKRKMSLRWRQENTPDKWRTPNKIRVSKLPKEDK